MMDLVKKCGRLRKMWDVVGAVCGRVSVGECLCAHAGMECCTVTAGWLAFHVPQRCVSYPYGGVGERPVSMGQDGHTRLAILWRTKEPMLESLAESPAFPLAASSIWPEETIRGGRIRAVKRVKSSIANRCTTRAMPVHLDSPRLPGILSSSPVCNILCV